MTAPDDRGNRAIDVAIVAPSMRILGGQAVQAARLVQAWQDDPEVRAWLVPVNPVPPGFLRGLIEVKYLRTLITQLCYWPLLVRELRRADIVHVFSASYFSFLLSPLPAVVVAKLLGKPTVLNYRSGEAPDHLRRSAVARRVLRWVERNAVPSSFLKGVFAEHGIMAEVIPNIVDVDRFRFRERAPLRPRILSTRNFEALYNVGCTLHAFREIQNRFPDATLTLVGAGSDGTRLQALAAELRLQNVQFAGQVSPEDIWRYYAAADIYVQTPDIDNMPASILEAFASGCAVVSTRAGGVPAIVSNGRDGLLVPCGDGRAVASAVVRLMEEPGLAQRLMVRGRENCEQYRWHAVRTGWLALYRNLLVPEAARQEPSTNPA